MSNFFVFRQVPLRTLALASGLVLGLSACDVTDVEPQNALAENVVYSDATRVALAVTGVYNAAQTGFYAPSPAVLCKPAVTRLAQLLPSLTTYVAKM
jgi:hypothetical protein